MQKKYFSNYLERYDKYKNRFWFVPCPLCGVTRWVKIGDHTRRCKSCANKASGLWSRAEKCPKWKGGKLIYRNEVLIFVKPNNSFFCMATNILKDVKDNIIGGYIVEHRLRMAEHIGRPLNSAEIVHHRNGIQTDNRLENLKLYATQTDHLKEHWAVGTFANRKKSSKPPWNKGLTKETDERVANYSKKVSLTLIDRHHGTKN